VERNIFRQGGQATGTGSWIVEPPPSATSGLFNFTLQWSVFHDFPPFNGFTSDWVLTAPPQPSSLRRKPTPCCWLASASSGGRPAEDEETRTNAGA